VYLKNYQVKVVKAFREFLDECRLEHAKAVQARSTLQINHNWVQEVFHRKSIEIKDSPTNGLGWYYPRVVFKVPTGGGKTLLAVEAIREYQERLAQRRTGLVVWIVPSETIYSQTVLKIKDKGNPLRQLLDQASGGRTLVLEKGQRLSAQDIEENLVILFVMIQSVSRRNGVEALKVFQDSGGFEGFFPPDNRTDLHQGILKEFPNLDLLSELSSLIRTSLGNAIRVSRPFIVVDELHKVFSDQARETLNSLNPELVLGLTATPKENMNVVVGITGLDLKEEEMVKLDLHVLPPDGSLQNDWKGMIREIKKHRESLEKKAKDLRQERDIYIRPMVLLQVESTGKNQRGNGTVHADDARECLIEMKVPPDHIAIKTSAQNDIEDVDLFSPQCPVRYIITKEALREGWDCSFAYILGIIPNANSNTGVTQLIGRILRQPHARKTGIAALDESYVYFTKGEVRSLIDKVVEGFQNEGLGDLVGKIAVKGAVSAGKRVVKIRHDFRKFESSFYLPAWVMVNGDKHHRRFSYDRDIKPLLNLQSFSLDAVLVADLKKAFSEERDTRNSFAITIDKDAKITPSVEGTLQHGKDEISVAYLTRRYSETIENPFLARAVANSHIKELEKELGIETLSREFGFIASFMCRRLEAEKHRQEEAAFVRLIEQKHLVLAVGTDPDFGWRVPETDEIGAAGTPHPFKYYLFEDVDVPSFNALEWTVAQHLEKQEKILWWFRNKTGRKWYSVQGWRQNKIHPDFVAARKEGDRVQLLYVLESKGEHLLGNADTRYKKAVFDVMTNQRKTKNVRKIEQHKLPFGELNDNVEFHVLEAKKEEEQIRSLFNL